MLAVDTAAGIWPGGPGFGDTRLERPALAPGPYLVVGLARAGSAAAHALLSSRPNDPVLAWDSATSSDVRAAAKRLRRRGAEVWLGGDGLAAVEAMGQGGGIVKSPGVDPQIPVLSRARARGMTVLDELEIGWRMSAAPLVGITGTNGKSTTAHLICAVMRAAGLRPQLAGNTEFGPPLSAVSSAASVVCEVSSFQLEATDAFLPEVAVLTNLSLEHLDRHGTMTRYGDAKRRMFIRSGRTPSVAVLNADDPFGRRLIDEVGGAGGCVISYGRSAPADIYVERAEWDARRANLRLRTPRGQLRLATRLPGAHNASNVAAAVAVGHILGVSNERIAQALETTDPPPGRWQVLTAGTAFDVIVDYAHTPDGIRQTLQAAREVVQARPEATLRTVFGAVGLSEHRKSQASARLVRELSDHVIFTTGTAPGAPRLVRLEELLRAATSGGEVQVVLDRDKAIRCALAAAGAGDVITVLGLGALGRQILDAAGTRIPFDDREAVRRALVERGLPWS